MERTSMPNSAKTYPEIIVWLKKQRILRKMSIQGVLEECEKLHARFLSDFTKALESDRDYEKKKYLANIPVPSIRTLQKVFSESAEQISFDYDTSLRLVVTLFLELQDDPEYDPDDSEKYYEQIEGLSDASR